jgi:tripartite-type tricarboxylate transporter receptor subunit TctC
MVWNVVLLLIVAALPLNASAQGPSFKDKSVRVIVGFPPGAGSDAEMISAVKIQPLVKQLLVISPGVCDFIKKITAKYLQR